MKTRFYMVLAIAVALILPGANAFAVDGRTPAELATDIGARSVDIGTAGTAISVPLSKGVALAYSGSTTEYAAGTMHLNGNREFATNNVTTTIWWLGCDNSPCTTTQVLEYGDAASDTLPGTGWSSQ